MDEMSDISHAPSEKPVCVLGHRWAASLTSSNLNYLLPLLHLFKLHMNNPNPNPGLRATVATSVLNVLYLVKFQ